MLYFAYGSNMSRKRLEQRIARVEVIGPARLSEHRLMFHKPGVDGSGKCDIEYTGHKGDCVHGVLFKIDSSKKAILDRYEGLGFGYDEKTVCVIGPGGKPYRAITYYATDTEPGLRPYCWYHRHVLEGAREHGLPDEYQRMLEAIEIIEDHDTERRLRELAVYGE